MRAVTPRIAALPSALDLLTAERRWIIWKWTPDKFGKPTKKPFRGDNPTVGASTKDDADWCDYAVCRDAVLNGKADGIGYCLMDGVVSAFDLDDSLDAEGNPLPRAWQLIGECASYVERSIGGNGLRILGFGEGAKVHRKHKVPNTPSSFETYRGATRFVVVTGDALDGHDMSLRNIDQPIDTWVARYDAAQRSRAATGKSVDPNWPRVPRPGDGSDLPKELLALIRDGVPEGKRSEQFHHAVGWLKDIGYYPDDVEEVMLCHPMGIGDKYEGRLLQEINRSYCKILGKERPDGS